MKALIMGAIFGLMLFPISFANPAEWNYLMPWNDASQINVVIESDFDVDENKIKDHNTQMALQNTKLMMIK
ncbi:MULTISPECIES: hypothetical protein [Nitrosopumilus]|uniref:Uncharacterized protein n=1 Tax=Nitrosopumilus piranensis TaxID=1582439 RepID=A0A0C5BY36_9ARCH|nr:MULTISPECIES: hypothetical protein [Nitrosopumilus]AJM93229.1 exported protein of unknown function [Nitrosopumilus piranensis]KAF6245587.1 hypothetical protein C6989_00090 [Nitrosopumilus sp. b2]